jgi:ParB family transcriptional regulator, chromosome partitioning protein
VVEKKRLGRGLGALLPGVDDGSALPPNGQVAVTLIDRNPHQPRKTFDQDELAALSHSIQNHGILQPLVVRATGERYQLIAGERRLRAAQEAGLDEVPVHVVNLNDREAFEAALVENVQRADLNAIEKAQGFADYIKQFPGTTHEQLAEKLGLDRTTVTNLVRLLDLDPDVQTAVRVGQISAGHARAILGITDKARQVSLCKEVVAKGLSVRATEALVKEQKPEPANGRPASEPVEKTAHVESLESELRQKLATRVEIRVKGKDAGQFVIGFGSNDDFERILEVLRR